MTILIAFICFLWSLSVSVELKSHSPGNSVYIEALHSQNHLLNRVLCFIWPLAMLSMGYLMFRYFFPMIMFGGNHLKYAEERKKVVESVSTSGAPLASFVCSGQLGGVYIRGPLMSVTIYPKGLTFRTLFSSPTALLTEEIKSVIYKRKFMIKGIEIQHRSHNISGPVVLGGISEDSDYACALNEIVGQDLISIRI